MKYKEIKPVVIPTDCDVTLSVQTVNPIIDNGKIQKILPNELCLLVEGGIYSENDIIEFCEPVLLRREGAKKLFDELEKFLMIPF